MGSYGIGPARIAAAAIEQGADDRGIVWPPSIAPWSIHLVALGKAGDEEREEAERLYARLRDDGIEVIYDDRDAGPGEKFADAELLGCPLRVTVGKRTLESGEVEVQVRRGREQRSVPLDGAADAVARLWAELACLEALAAHGQPQRAAHQLGVGELLARARGPVVV